MESPVNPVRVELTDDKSIMVNPSFWKASKYRTLIELLVSIITLLIWALAMWTATTRALS
ncbi:hypothetical protein GW17_00046636 [Ensete ventricosum]|nr:hypothetical protein GW17_00046636 [Ensete ventricosum]